MERIIRKFLNESWKLVGNIEISPELSQRVRLVKRALDSNDFDRAYGLASGDAITLEMLERSVIEAKI